MKWFVTVEIRNLDDLMALVRKFGKIVLWSKQIEIYDKEREIIPLIRLPRRLTQKSST
jgi:hypothetical protein